MNNICFPVTDYLNDRSRQKDNVHGQIYKWSKGDQPIGDKSSYGQIWQACLNKNCKYVLKYQKIGKPINEEISYEEVSQQGIEKEIKLQKILAKHKISPKVTDYWFCNDENGKISGGVIIMPALQMTISLLLERYQTISSAILIISHCIDLLNRTHKLGIIHGDPHLKNIMVTYDIKSNGSKYIDESYKYYLIDMGRSNKTKNKKLRFDDYSIFFTSLFYESENNSNLNYLNVLRPVFEEFMKTLHTFVHSKV